jgi:hypothetical protein
VTIKEKKADVVEMKLKKFCCAAPSLLEEMEDEADRLKCDDKRTNVEMVEMMTNKDLQHRLLSSGEEEGWRGRF